jgi:hypothetical protein
MRQCKPPLMMVPSLLYRAAAWNVPSIGFAPGSGCGAVVAPGGAGVNVSVCAEAFGVKASDMPIAATATTTGRIRPQELMGPDITPVFDRNRGEFKPADQTISSLA